MPDSPHDIDLVSHIGPQEDLAVERSRPFQFRVRHLLFFLLAAGLISGLVHNFSGGVATVVTVLFSIGGPIFVLIIVIAMAIQPVFSYPWKLANDYPLETDIPSSGEERI